MVVIDESGGAKSRVVCTVRASVLGIRVPASNDQWRWRDGGWHHRRRCRPRVVNLKEARNFSSNKNFIYVFRKLQWGSLSVDLLPHPDMFTDSRAQEGPNKRDEDGAKRVFFGGERFLEGISGQAYITIQRTQFNDPLGLEVGLHISEAVCPALSEPGLRAFLRFLTGLYVCLNRGDIDPVSQQRSTEAAGRSLVSIIVDHVFLCVKDAG
ncbi:hypothetical protein Cgig2_006358 [Carnegiea gigantea]|uniref:Uncharacterized protein n=1 Tax=Carnegiea gigantea TaxID=171969 RepID=A0A9Q1Q4H4_9CARY|nr:hypothetical protein Cgig2_006358 [Carnegiea gigantea]